MIKVTVAFGPSARAPAHRPNAAAGPRRVDSGEFPDYAAMACALGFTRARITQIMGLFLLAPDIQEDILRLEFPAGATQPSECALRQGLRSIDWREQWRAWADVARPARAS